MTTQLHIPSKPNKPKSWNRRWRYYYWRLIRLRSTPDQMARGLAVGVFAGMFPIVGLQMVVAIGLAMLVRGNKWLAAVGTWFSNPLTDIPILLFNLHIGRWVLRYHYVAKIAIHSQQDLVNLGKDVLIVLLTGCFVVGIVSASLTYLISYRLFQRMLERHHRRRFRP